MASRRAYSTADVELLEELARREARASFWAFRRYMRPKMLTGWFQEDMADGQLQRFYDELLEGKRPKLVICSPPQHGKSETITDFLAWVAGKNPDLRKIFASYSERLGVRTNLKLQRMYDGERYQGVFPETRINSSNVVTVSGQVLRNREILEYVGHEGYFRNTTVLGAVTGEGLDLGVVDDPIKGRAEAQSKALRDRAWDWLNDDFMTRFSEHAGLLMILTRWHLDDPAGRLEETDENVRIVRYPALAEKDELYRRKGDPLFPELKSLEFLLERRQRMTTASWESLYQQNPTVVGGDTFPVERFQIMEHAPTAAQIKRTVRYWDKAGTQGGGAHTAGVKMHVLVDGRYVVEDVRRGQWAADEREQRLQQTAELDGHGTIIWLEQEPGSGGKESAQLSVRRLAPYRAYADKVTTGKEVRAEDYAAQVQAGNVWLVRAPWNRPFMDEHEVWPNAAERDQVDAAAGAFMKLTLSGKRRGSRTWGT